MNRIKGLLVLVLVLLFSSSVYATDNTKNGITYSQQKLKYGRRQLTATLHTAQNPSTTLIFNDGDETANTSGAVWVRNYNSEITITIDATTIGSTSVEVHIQAGYAGTEEKDALSIDWSKEYTKIYFSAQTANEDLPYVFGGTPDFVRVGLIATGTPGADVLTIKLKAVGGIID